jgi:hypothetical protein
MLRVLSVACINRGAATKSGFCNELQPIGVCRRYSKQEHRRKHPKEFRATCLPIVRNSNDIQRLLLQVALVDYDLTEYLPVFLGNADITVAFQIGGRQCHLTVSHMTFHGTTIGTER